mgnify:FL=1
MQQYGYKEEQAKIAIACLKIITDSLGITFNEEEQYVKHSGVNSNAEKILKIAKELKLKAKKEVLEYYELEGLPVPALAIMKDGSFLVLGKNNDKVVLIFRPEVGKPETIAKETFVEGWSGEVVIIKRPFSIKSASQRFNLYWFIPIIVKYKKYFIEILIASFFLQLFGLVTPLFTQVIIDKVIVHNGLSTLDILAICLIIAAAFQAIMSIARTYLSAHTTNKIDMILGARLFRHVTALPLRYFETRRVGDTLTRISALNSIREFLTNSSMTVFLDTFFSIVFFAVMFYYSWSLTLIALIPLPLYLIQNMLVTPIYQKRLETVWASGAESNAFLVESITGVQTVKSLALEPQFNNRWEKILAKYIKDTFNNAKFNIWLSSSNSVIQSIMTFGILLFGGHMVMSGKLTIGQLIAFQMLAGQASAQIFRLSGMWQTCQQTMLAVERLGDILNTAPEPLRISQENYHDKIKGKVSFENVSFRYNAEMGPVIDDVSFEILPGMKVGIVGRSGSGKSTITKLVQRLYLPEMGKVKIDDIDIMELDPTWFRKQIGVVLQENYLFNGSVRENIALAKPSATIDEVINVAIMAGAHEFILELSEGYDTKIGERGTGLSGGQQQRIAIARALISNPSILIFDEATSALDYQSERIIMDNLDVIAKDRTMLMIAHRLTTVRNCDLILVVENGKIIEHGKHRELIEKNGTYYNMYVQQEV